jgi:hypothetical protein
MKLQYILEAGHWEVAPGNYPNCITKQKKGRMSLLVHPKDRDKFINWGRKSKNSLNEDIYPNRTAVVYHRTKPENLEAILSKSWDTGGGTGFGAGLYATLFIDDQFESMMDRTYGSMILKLKVAGLDKYLITPLGVAKKILGTDYSISSQLERLNATDLFTPESIQQFDRLMSRHSSNLGQVIYDTNPKIQTKVRGMIYQAFEGYCLVKYHPIEDGSVTLLGYTEAYCDNQRKYDAIKSNQVGAWITSTDKAALKSLFRAKSKSTSV